MWKTLVFLIVLIALLLLLARGLRGVPKRSVPIVPARGDSEGLWFQYAGPLTRAT
jgi:hypothetical protein